MMIWLSDSLVCRVGIEILEMRMGSLSAYGREMWMRNLFGEELLNVGTC